MPELKCTVENCVHNKSTSCDLGIIDVGGGDKAIVKCETNCSSFVDYAMDNYTNSTKGATLNTEISCNASNCQYNEASSCQAGFVEVQGSNACQSEDTQCSSFSQQMY